MQWSLQELGKPVAFASRDGILSSYPTTPERSQPAVTHAVEVRCCRMPSGPGKLEMIAVLFATIDRDGKTDRDVETLNSIARSNMIDNSLTCTRLTSLLSTGNLTI